MEDRYFLLSPEPIVRDSWQQDGTYRFVGVPFDLPVETFGDGSAVFGYARQIVTNCFTIDYMVDIEPITIKVIEEDEFVQEDTNNG